MFKKKKKKSILLTYHSYHSLHVNARLKHKERVLFSKICLHANKAWSIQIQ